MTCYYCPDAYRIILVDNHIVKVYASWSGGYLDGDAWKLNSGTVKIEQDEHYYYFKGYSGSTYQLRKEGEISSLTSYTQSVYNELLETGLVKEISVEQAIQILEEC
jgi:hypothetical protein